MSTTLAVSAQADTPASSPATTPTTSNTGAPNEQSAQAQAEASGDPVPVPSETTETSSVVANPDGTFTLTSSREPVRVQQDGAWVPIDPTLRINPDGSLTPAATTEDVTFSGGGSGPAVTVTSGSDVLSFSWPTPLPVPVVSGATATYPSVLPGVDLELTAEADTYTEVLVVHSAAAAANPALAQLELTTSASGLKVESALDGGFTATDASGSTVFQAATPIMWDSSSSGGPSTTPTADDPAGGQTTSIDASMPTIDSLDGTASATMTLTPPADALTGPGVVYPLYVDPSFPETKYVYAVISNDSGENYFNSGGQLKVGECPVDSDSSCGSAFEARSYFELDTTHLINGATNAHIYAADVNVDEIHGAAGCTSEPVDLYTAGDITASTTWPGPINRFMQEVSSNRGDQCSSAPAGIIDFNNAAVVSDVQANADADNAHIDFMLRAPTDSSQTQWKRFSSNVTMDVTYDYPPSIPTALTIGQKVQCPHVPIYTRDSTPTLTAQATSNNPGVTTLALNYDLQDGNGNNLRENVTPVGASNNSPQSWTTNSSNTNSAAPEPDGSYAFRAQATSGSSGLSPDQTSSYSGWYPFTIDTVAPATPTISSFDYPANSWGAPQGGNGTFKIASTSADTAGFTYAVDSTNLPAVNDSMCTYTNPGYLAATSGSATLTMPTNLTPGPHTLTVKAFDGAHNTSGATSYTFYVAPSIAGEASSKQEAENLTVTQPAGQNAIAYDESPNTLWSNGAEEHLIAPTTNPTPTPTTPQQFSFTINTPIEGDYALGVQLTTQNHFGILAFTLDNNPLVVNGSPVQVDTYSPTVGTQYLQLGGAHLAPGTTHTITVQIIGKNPASTDFVYNGTYGGQTLTNVHDGGYAAGIDFFTVVPLNQAAFSTITAAMNNHGIAIDGTTPANIGPSSNASALSEQALAQAATATGTQNLDAGHTVTIDGINFTMPPANANGNDNVMADGQTIDLPTPIVANNIELLALATCTPPPNHTTAPNLTLTVNFQDGTYQAGSGQNLPSVPEWSTGTTIPPGTPGITVAATVPYSDTGTTPNTSSFHPTIYHLTIPTGYTGSPVTSIVLPNPGSNFTNSCNTATLHILAISTS